MDIVMEEMKGAKIHIFESGSDSKVAKTFRWNFADVPVLRSKAKKFIDEQLAEVGIVLKRKKPEK
jgi:hypothetical protein